MVKTSSSGDILLLWYKTSTLAKLIKINTPPPHPQLQNPKKKTLMYNYAVKAIDNVRDTDFSEDSSMA